MRYSRVNLEIMKTGFSIRKVARRLGLKPGITYMTTTGRRHNREVQEQLAQFLGVRGQELWGEDWWEKHQALDI